MDFDLAKPFRVFFIVWMLTIFLHQLNLTSNIVEVNGATLTLIGTCIVVIYLTSIEFLVLPNISMQKLINYDMGSSASIFLYRLFVFWIFGTAVDIAYSGGVPLLWIATDAGKDYTEFGVPSFHGVVNAAYLFFTTSLFLKFLVVRQRCYLAGFVLMLLWPIFMLGRGILLGVLVQCLGVYLILNRIRLSKIFLIIFLSIVVVVVFGILGNIRSGGNVLDYLVIPDGVLEFLPDGFLWVYVYITTGINNIYYSYPSLDPVGYPFYSILNLLPSAIKSLVGDFQLNESLIELVDDNLNTSTFLSGYVSDFGYIGGVAASVILGVTSRLFYDAAKRGRFGGVIGFSVMFQCLVFSPFYDMLFLLPTLFQLAIAVFYIRYTDNNFRNELLNFNKSNLLI